MIIYFDESGNTGDNLLDPGQLYFSLASNNYTKKEAVELLNLFDTPANEIHFKRIIRYQKHRDTLISFFNHELVNEERIKFTYAEKPFALLYRLIDTLIEPFYYKYGVEFFDEANINNAYGYLLYDILNKKKHPIPIFEFVSGND